MRRFLLTILPLIFCLTFSSCKFAFHLGRKATETTTANLPADADDAGTRLANDGTVSPTNLSVSVIEATFSKVSIRVSWKWEADPTGVLYFQLQCSLQREGEYKKCGFIPATQTMFVYPDGVPNVPNYFRVVALGEDWESEPSPIAVITPSLDPAPPTSFVATALSGTLVKLNFDNPTPGASFKLSRQEGNGEFVPHSDVPVNALSALDSTAQPGRRYRYKIIPWLLDSEGDFNFGEEAISNEVTTPSTALPKPTLRASIERPSPATTHVRLSWDPIAAPAQHVVVQRAANGGSFTTLATLASSSTGFTDSAVSVGVLYQYQTFTKLVENGNTLNSPPSDFVSVTVTPDLVAPTNVGILPSSSSTLDLSWFNGSVDATHTEISMSQTGAEFAVVATPTSNISAYRVTNLQPDTTYYFKLRSFAGTAYSPYATISGTTQVLVVQIAAPTGLAITETGVDKTKISWQDNATNETGYQLLVQSEGQADVTLTFGANAQAAEIPTAPGKTYYVRARAYNDQTYSGWSGPLQITVPSIPSLRAPVLTAQRSPASNQKIDLVWTDESSNEASYIVYRASNGGQVTLRTVAANTTRYTDEETVPNTAYTYQVGANFGSNTAPGPLSNSASATTGPLEPPTGLQATALSSSSIRINWNPAGRVELFASRDGISYSVIAMLSAGTSTYTYSGLLADTEYKFQARSLNTAGDYYSGPTSPVSARTMAAQTTVSAPTALTAQRSSSAGQEIEVRWVNNASNAENVLLYRATGSGSSFLLHATLPATASQYIDRSLAPSTLYTYKARAKAANGESGDSNAASATTAAATPAVPQAFQASNPTATSITLTWSPMPSGTSVEIQRSTDGVNFTAVQMVSSGSSWINQGLAAVTQYYYRARACSGSCSDFTPLTGQKTLYSLAVPTDFRGNAPSSTSIQLFWTDQSQGEIGYRVEMTSDRNSDLTTVSLGANASGFTLNSGLVAGGSYTFKVRVAGPDNSYSAYAGPITITTPGGTLAAPSGLYANYNPSPAAGSALSAILSWNDTNTTETGFRIYRSTNKGTFDLIGSPGANITKFADETLVANTDYLYKVQAVNGNIVSPDSNIVSVRITPTSGSSTLKAPTNLIKNDTESTATHALMTWTNNEPSAGIAIRYTNSFNGDLTTSSLPRGANKFYMSYPASHPRGTKYTVWAFHFNNVVPDSPSSNVITFTKP